MTKENLDFINNNGEKVLQLNDDIFKNIYAPQMVEFYDKVEQKNNKIKLKYESKSLNMDRSITSKNIIGVSMFAGAGGLDIGAHLAGINIKYASDINEDCVKTLESNDIFDNSIKEAIDINDIDVSSIKKKLQDEDYDKIFLIGGPPCQPFSKAGYWVTNSKRDPMNDKRNMIPAYFRIIKELSPDVVVMENVESILHPSNIKIVEYIKEQFENLDYKMNYYKLNAADYGLPQKRKRVFFIASKEHFEVNFKPFRSDKKKDDLPDYEPVVNWIGDFKSEFKPVEGKWSGELTEIPPGKNYISLSEKEGHPNPRFVAGKRYWSSLLKLSPLLPSWTIIASPGHWEGPFHWENRKITNEEAAAIQTFPRKYKFFGGETSVRKQIGNAVPPLLSRIIFEEVIKCIK